MVYYLILCRSLTYAQRTEAVLLRCGIKAHIRRAPKAIDSEGCSYGVKISEQDLTPALVTLKRAGLPPKRVFIMTCDGGSREVLL